MIDRKDPYDNRPEYLKALDRKKTAPGVELSAEEKKERKLLAKAKMAAEKAAGLASVSVEEGDGNGSSGSGSGSDDGPEDE